MLSFALLAVINFWHRGNCLPKVFYWLGNRAGSGVNTRKLRVRAAGGKHALLAPALQAGSAVQGS